MAQLALTVLPYAIPGPGTVAVTSLRVAGAVLGGVIGGQIDRAIFPQKRNEGPRLEDLKVQISSYGSGIPELWGTMRLAGNMIWADELNEVENTDGGKGSPEQTSYKYDATFAIGLCKGPINGIIRVWADTELIYDARESPITELPSYVSGTVVSYSGGTMEVVTSATATLFATNFGLGRYEITFDSGALSGQSFEIASWNALTNEFRLADFPFSDPSAGDDWHIEGLELLSSVTPRENGTFDFDLYLGTEVQEPDPTIEAVEGAGRVPAFRGLAYIVIKRFRLEQYGNRIPNFTFEVAKDTTQRNQVIAYPDSVGNEANNYERPDIFQRTMLLHPDGRTIVTEGFAFDVQTGEWKAKDLGGGSFDYMQYEFDFDEEGKVYAWRIVNDLADECQFVKYDMDIGFMAEIAAGPIIDTSMMPDGGSVLRVSRNAAFPYMWWYEAASGAMRGGPRDDLGGNAYTFPFPDDDADAKCWHIDVDQSTGNSWSIYYAQGGSEKVYVRRAMKHPTLGVLLFNTWEITSDLPLPATVDGLSIKFDLTTQQIIIGVTDQFQGTSPDSDHLYFLNVSGTLDSLNGPIYVDVLDDVDGLSLMDSNGDSAAFSQGPFGGKMYFTAGVGEDLATYRFIRVDLATREVDGEWYPEAYGAWFDRFQYIPSLNAIFCDWALGGAGGFTNGGPHEYYVLVLLDRITDAGAPLSLIVSDISEMAGLDSGDIIVSALSDTVDGYVLNDRMTARAAIEPLMQAYFFDAVEVDGIVKFIKRGGSSVVSIPESDLAAHPSGSQRPQELITTRQQELELPQTVEVSYVSRPFDYQIGTQRERRLVTRSQEKMLIRLPISLTNDEAKQIAVKWLGIAWLQRTRHEIQVSRKYMWLTPGDVIQVTEGGVTRTVRIEDGSYEGGIIRFPLVQEDSEVYESDAPGVGGSGSGGTGGDDTGVIPITGYTKFAIGDIPTLPAFESSYSAVWMPGVYLAATGQESGWPGCEVFRSPDGDTWGSLSSVTNNGIVGKAVTALADVADPFIWDLGNTVQVQLLDPDDTLSGLLESAVLNGGNLAMLGGELISFRTVTDNGNGLYTLSNLIRGRYGTDDQTGQHVVGEDFMMLDASLIKFAQMQTSFLNTLVRFRAVTMGQEFANGTNATKTITYRNLRPLSPQHVRCYRDPNDGVLIIIDWIRRTRIGGEMVDGVDVPLGETVGSFEIDLYSGSTFLRTVNNEPNFGAPARGLAYYLEGQQILDGVSYSDPITAIVYQISTWVGRGIASAPATSNQ